MLYVFIVMLVGAFIRQRDKLFKEKRNIFLFALMSLTGIILGFIHTVSPYIPSIAMSLEKHMK